MRETYHIMQEDDLLKKLFPSPPLLAFRQTANIGNSIVRSKLPPLDELVGSVSPCGASRCKACARISNDITFERNNFKHTIRQQFSCKSFNVVYLIRCRKCPDTWYIGETCQTMGGRMIGHRRSITENKGPVGKHFSTGRTHSEKDMVISVLQGGYKDVNTRRVAEQRFIRNFNTLHPHGLNIDKDFLSHY